MTRKLVITSGKGGVGKTTITACLGIQLASVGYKVVLVDADMGLNNLDVVMGVENRISYDFYDVLEGRCRISQALIKDGYYENLAILPSTRINAKKVSAGEFCTVINKLKGADFVIVDSPAGIDLGFHRAVCGADEAYVVVTPSLSSVRDADKVLSLLSSYKLQRVNVIVNRVRADLVLKGNMIAPGDIGRLLKTPVSGIIPDADNIAMTTNLGYVKDKSEAGKAFNLLARNVIEDRHRCYDYLASVKSLGGRLRRFLR